MTNEQNTSIAFNSAIATPNLGIADTELPTIDALAMLLEVETRIYSINGSELLVDLLQQRSQNQSDRPAYIFLQNGETESNRFTYGELDRKAKAIAAQLQDYRGERALLLYSSGLEFISAFFGCMYAGVIAVPVYPPRRNQKSRLLAIANDDRGRLASTTTSILADVEKRWSSELEAGLELLATDALEANSTEFVPQSVTPNDLAFLQYTALV